MTTTVKQRFAGAVLRKLRRQCMVAGHTMSQADLAKLVRLPDVRTGKVKAGCSRNLINRAENDGHASAALREELARIFSSATGRKVSPDDLLEPDPVAARAVTAKTRLEDETLAVMRTGPRAAAVIHGLAMALRLVRLDDGL